MRQRLLQNTLPLLYICTCMLILRRRKDARRVAQSVAGPEKLATRIAIHHACGAMPVPLMISQVRAVPEAPTSCRRCHSVAGQATATSLTLDRCNDESASAPHLTRVGLNADGGTLQVSVAIVRGRAQAALRHWSGWRVPAAIWGANSVDRVTDQAIVEVAAGRGVYARPSRDGAIWCVTNCRNVPTVRLSCASPQRHSRQRTCACQRHSPWHGLPLYTYVHLEQWGSKLEGEGESPSPSRLQRETELSGVRTSGCFLDSKRAWTNSAKKNALPEQQPHHSRKLLLFTHL